MDYFVFCCVINVGYWDVLVSFFWLVWVFVDFVFVVGLDVDPLVKDEKYTVDC